MLLFNDENGKRIPNSIIHRLISNLFILAFNVIRRLVFTPWRANYWETRTKRESWN
jgi:hypothetical protein